MLAVDDEESVRIAVTMLLRRQGYDVEQASNPTEALGLLRQHEFNVLVTDLNMGSESGLDLARSALAIDPDLAVLMLTGVDDLAVAEEALALGAFGYLIKPIELNELRIAMMNALRRREVRWPVATSPAGSKRLSGSAPPSSPCVNVASGHSQSRARWESSTATRPAPASTPTRRQPPSSVVPAKPWKVTAG